MYRFQVRRKFSFSGIVLKIFTGFRFGKKLCPGAFVRLVLILTEYLPFISESKASKIMKNNCTCVFSLFWEKDSRRIPRLMTSSHKVFVVYFSIENYRKKWQVCSYIFCRGKLEKISIETIHVFTRFPQFWNFKVIGSRLSNVLSGKIKFWKNWLLENGRRKVEEWNREINEE